MVLLLISANAYVYYQHYRKSHFFCQGNAIVKNEDYTFKARTSLTLEGDVGQAMIDGVIIDKAGKEVNLSRMVSFHFEQHGMETYMRNYESSEFHNNTEDTSVLKKIAPLYIFSDSMTVRMRFFSISDHSFLLTSEQYMVLYCEK